MNDLTVKFACEAVRRKSVYSKPAVAKKASVLMNGTKKLTLKTNGYKISSVKWNYPWILKLIQIQ